MDFKNAIGLDIKDEKSVFIAPTVKIGKNVTIYENNRIDGNSEMPVPSFDITSNVQMGNEGDGFVRIMYLSSDFAYFLTLKCRHNIQLALMSSITFLLKNN